MSELEKRNKNVKEGKMQNVWLTRHDVMNVCVYVFMYKQNMMLLLFLLLSYQWDSVLKVLISENWI